jgi:mRNA-degrading endonuclease RelE of RelBE toxin-antitoxin system
VRVIYSGKFLKAAASLPLKIQTRLDSLVAILSEDPFHPLLHSKPLGGKLTGSYSFRITRDWRGIFVFEAKDVVKLAKVGNRKDVYSRS